MIEQSNENDNRKVGETTLLIIAAKTGSQEAVGKLHQKFENLALSFIMEFLPHQLRAKIAVADISQEVWKGVLESFPSFQGTTFKVFYVWLRIIVKSHVNKQRDIFQAQKRDPSKEVPIGSSLDVSDNKQPLPGDILEIQEIKQILRDAINRLPVDQRTVLILRLYNESSILEIAEILEKTIDAVRGLLHRGLETLRAQPELKDLISE